MVTHNWQSTEDFIDSLSQLCHQGKTGALHFVSTDQHAGRILIRKGEIIDFRYSFKKGIHALELLKRIKEISYCFTSKKIDSVKDENLPTTSLFLISLRTVLI